MTSQWKLSSAWYTFVAFEWKAGRDYLREYSETEWAYVIGSTRTETVSITPYVTLTCTSIYDQSYNPNCPVEPTPENYDPCNCWTTVGPTTQNILVQEPSDGLVKASSQRADGTSWQGVPLVGEGVNHQEMRDVREGTPMRAAFNEIFDNSSGKYSPVFTVRRR